MDRRLARAVENNKVDRRLYLAVWNNNVDEVEALLNAGASPDACGDSFDVCY